MRILTVFGTRPEAIKCAPVVLALNAEPGVESIVCVTAQHRQMLDQVLDIFALKPDYDLNIMKPNQSLTQLTANALEGVGRVLDEVKPDWVIVQGDTTTAFAAALAAFYRKIKVAHVEAGLRSGNIFAPWPEETNRQMVGRLTTMHFPPTAGAAENLRREAVPDAVIEVTGNTVIDALQWVAAELDRDTTLADRALTRLPKLNSARRMILVTGHRRENFDGGLERVCRGLRQLAERGDVEIVYPVHLNPNVQSVARTILADHPAIHLIEPLDYIPFVALMRQAYMIVTDSGGIQEEAPSLGKPVLVTRDTTERPEAVQAGTAKLVGTQTDVLLAAASELLDDPAAYARMAQAKNPFGDGKASQRIVQRLKGWRD
jgi:UDP-N-acetylglucosamine 2-epimerase (non-hydrolysing)